MRRKLATDEALRQRNTLRLRGYDYSQPGAYFVTTIAHDRACMFGEVVDGTVRLNEIGQVVHEEWAAIPARRVGVELDAFIVMPNHVHGIVRILSNASGEASLAPTRAVAGVSRGSLGSIVGSFKAGVSRRVAAMRRGSPIALWQSGYQDHIVRTDGELDRIRRYIAANPEHWATDHENPRRKAAATQASPPQGQMQQARRGARIE